jgi:hypothetical protein
MLKIISRFKEEHLALGQILTDISKTDMHTAERKKLFTELRTKLTAHTVSEIEELYDTANEHSKLDLIDMVHAYRKVMGIMDAIIEVDFEMDSDFNYIRDSLQLRIALEESIMSQVRELLPEKG